MSLSQNPQSPLMITRVPKKTQNGRQNLTTRSTIPKDAKLEKGIPNEVPSGIFLANGGCRTRRYEVQNLLLMAGHFRPSESTGVGKRQILKGSTVYSTNETDSDLHRKEKCFI